MSFDARSLERLQQLGRTLPKPLPKPESPGRSEPKATEKRHKVETETDPDALFHELMQVSPDGTVPPHLLERLRQAEEQKRRQRQEQQREPRPQQRGGSSPSSAGAQPQPRGKGAGKSSPGRPDPGTAADHPDLYTAFHALLLEDEED